MASYLETSKRSFYSAILVVEEGLAKNCLALLLKEDHLSNKCLKKSDLTDCLKILSVPVYKNRRRRSKANNYYLENFPCCVQDKKY